MREGTAKTKAVRYQGTSTVEMALVLPILITFALAIMAMGIVFLRAQQITNAARHGARVAVRFGADADDVVSEVSPLLLPNFSVTEVVINEGVGEEVKVTVKGTGLDFLGMSTKGFIGLPIPESFTATVKMAKEGP